MECFFWFLILKSSGFGSDLMALASNTAYFQYNDFKLSKANDGGRVFLASVASMSLLTRQFVNGEGHGNSVMLQIHHDPTESRLDDQRVESRGRVIWGKWKGRDREFGWSLEANNGCTDWCRAVEWCGNHHLCGRGDPAIALGGHAIVIWQLMSCPYFMGKC